MFKVSEAASLGLHAMALLGGGGRLNVQTISRRLTVSAAHLSKVMQRLERAGLVRGSRGPGGGYELTRPASEFTLRQVFEAIEGPLARTGCLLDKPVCDGNCILGGVVDAVETQVAAALTRTRLSDLGWSLGNGGEAGVAA